MVRIDIRKNTIEQIFQKDDIIQGRNKDINKLIARNEEEIPIFEAVDKRLEKERKERWDLYCKLNHLDPKYAVSLSLDLCYSLPVPSPLITEEELPNWLVHPMDSSTPLLSTKYV